VRVLLLHLDGRLPNLALMRLAAHYRGRGAEVTLRRADNPRLIEPQLGDPKWDHVFASAIFERTQPNIERVRQIYPDAVIGGTGVNLAGGLLRRAGATLEELGIGPEVDYSDYPTWRQSLGFTQRGCRLRCSFCVVPTKEGPVREAWSIREIWRGEPWPREVILLDNDFFGQPRWADRIAELVAGGFKVNFNQGINARMLTDETAAALASVEYRNDHMVKRKLHTAWDNRKDERRLFAGLEALVRHGVKPGHITVYMLIGYWPGETHDDRDYRRRQLRDFGCDPYPMPFVRTPELIGFQRWVIWGYDRNVSWSEWTRSRWQARPGDLATGALPFDQ